MNRFLRYSLQNQRKIRMMLFLHGAIVQKNAIVLALDEVSVTLRLSASKPPVTVALSDILSCDYARGDHGEEQAEMAAMFTLSRWPYIQTVAPAGDLQADAASLLTANGKPETASHCLAVANTGKRIAARFGLDEAAVYHAALLHDIANIVKPQDMLAYAAERRWAIDPAEGKHPFLLHQRLSAEIAEVLFGVRDAAVLSAIRCHTTLKENPSGVDMALFLADKLSWDQDGAPPYANAVSAALERSLCHASLCFIQYVLDHGMVLCPHQWLMDALRWLERRC